MDPTIKVDLKGSRITIHKNDKLCTVIQVILKEKGGYRITVNRNDYAAGTKIIDE